MRGDAHSLSHAESTAAGASHPKLTHTHQGYVRVWVPFGTSDFTYLPAVCISFLAKEHSEGGNAVSKRKAIQRPRQGYYIPPVSLTETADTLTHNQNRFAIHGCSPVPRFQ